MIISLWRAGAEDEERNGVRRRHCDTRPSTIEATPDDRLEGGERAAKLPMEGGERADDDDDNDADDDDDYNEEDNNNNNAEDGVIRLLMMKLNYYLRVIARR